MDDTGWQVIERFDDKRRLAEVVAKSVQPGRDLALNPLYLGDPAWGIAEDVLTYFRSIVRQTVD